MGWVEPHRLRSSFHRTRGYAPCAFDSCLRRTDAALRSRGRPHHGTDANCAVIRSVNSPSRSTTSKMYRSQSLERPEMSMRM